MRACFLWMLCFLILDGGTAQAAYRRYTIQELSPPTESMDIESNILIPGGLNDLGQAVFTVQFPRTLRIPGVVLEKDRPNEIFFYDRYSTREISTLGGENAQALGLNNSGQIVGVASSPHSYGTFLGRELYANLAVHSHLDQMEPVDAPPTYWSAARAINDQGTIVGYYDSPWHQRSFRYDPSEGFTDLGVFDSGYAYAVDINNGGDILINAYELKPYRVFNEDYFYSGIESIIVSGDEEIRLTDTHHLLYGLAINEKRQVVGSFAAIPGQEFHGFYWDEQQGLIDLGTMGEQSGVADINDFGAIVGAAGNDGAIVYDSVNGRQRLIDLIPADAGWYGLDAATHINNRGQILGFGRRDAGEKYWGARIFLMTPVPEPNTLFLASLLGALMLFERGCIWHRDTRQRNAAG